MVNANCNWRRLLMHCVERACRRAVDNAGIKIAMSTAIIPITTKSSVNVKPQDDLSEVPGQGGRVLRLSILGKEVKDDSMATLERAVN
jgi:hypothetical protein